MDFRVAHSAACAPCLQSVFYGILTLVFLSFLTGGEQHVPMVENSALSRAWLLLALLFRILFGMDKAAGSSRGIWLTRVGIHLGESDLRARFFGDSYDHDLPS